MRTVLWTVVAALLVVLPVSTGAWGIEVHRLITRRAIENLPDTLQPMYASHRDFVVEHSVDPDEWRVVGLRGDLGLEDPNHFFEIANPALGDPAPYDGVPRDWDALVTRVGPEAADKIGRLPFRIVEMYGRLVTHFKGIATNTAYAADNGRYVTAILAHYVEDAHQPLHVATNYDGQLTDQRGLHSRFETQLSLRLWPSLHLRPVEIRPIPDVKAAMFRTIVTSDADIQPILDADKRAAAGLARDAATNRLIYDDAYYSKMAHDLQPMIEDRISEATTTIASLVVQAWVDAGRPAVR